MIRSPILHSLRSLFDVKFERFLRFASTKAFSKALRKRCASTEGEADSSSCSFFIIVFLRLPLSDARRLKIAPANAECCASISSSFVFNSKILRRDDSCTCFRKSSSSISSSNLFRRCRLLLLLGSSPSALQLLHRIVCMLLRRRLLRRRRRRRCQNLVCQIRARRMRFLFSRRRHAPLLKHSSLITIIIFLRTTNRMKPKS